MITYCLTCPLTWISVAIVSLCIVGIDFIWRPILADLKVTIIPALPDNVDLPGDTVVDGRPGGIREGKLEV